MDYSLYLKFHLYSIKTRIKTVVPVTGVGVVSSFHLYSIKTRIKTSSDGGVEPDGDTFHLYSIKTRIKTRCPEGPCRVHRCSICIPLKQGLRQLRILLSTCIFLFHLYSIKTRIKTRLLLSAHLPHCGVPFVFH